MLSEPSVMQDSGYARTRQEARVARVQPEPEVAAVMLSATPHGPARVLAHVDWPVAARSLGIAVGLAFAVSLGEFGATSFLARPEHPTLPVVIFRLIGRPGAENLGMAFAACAVLGAVTAAVMALAERLGSGAGEF